MFPTRGVKPAILAIAALLVGAAIILARTHFVEGGQAPRERLGMMTSLPIYWDDGAGIEDILSGEAQLPWVREALETHYEIVPLDTFASSGTGQGEAPAASPLADLRHLLIVQPRGLSPADNVALDRWVRAGGRLIYALDPMLTGSYAVPLGDPRHPTLTGLLPPVLPRWGLQMQFTERQPFELHEVATDFGPMPVMMAGQITLTDEGKQQCQLEADGLLATCRIEKGQVTLVADAVLFELQEGDPDYADMLLALIAHGFEN